MRRKRVVNILTKEYNERYGLKKCNDDKNIRRRKGYPLKRIQKSEKVLVGSYNE